MPIAIVKNNPLSSVTNTVTWEPHETLEGVYQKVIADSKLDSEYDYSPYFKVFVNGYEIKREFWKHTRAKEKAIIPKELCKEIIIALEKELILL